MLPGGVVPSLKPAESLARLRGCGWGRGGWLHASWGQKQRGQEDCVPFQRGPCLFPVLTQLQRNSVLAIYGDVLNRVRRCFKPCPMYCQIFPAMGVRMCVCACVCACMCVHLCVCMGGGVKCSVPFPVSTGKSVLFYRKGVGVFLAKSQTR